MFSVGALNADEDEAVRHLEGLEHGGFEAAGVEFGLAGEELEDDAVDDGFDGVVLALFQAHALGQLGHLAVDAGAEALLVERFELFAELAHEALVKSFSEFEASARKFGDVQAFDALIGYLFQFFQTAG